MGDFLEELAAFLVTSPVFVLTYWAFFLRRLPREDRETIRDVRRSEEFRRHRAGAFFVAAAVVLGTSSSVRDVPLLVRLAAWAVMWPGIALAIASWSLRIRRRGHALWVESWRGRSVDPVRLVLLLFAAMIPGVTIVMIFARQPWE